MRGLIAEIRGAYAAVLTENGRVERVRNDGYQVGQAVTLRRYRVSSLSRTLRLCAAAAALVVCFIGGTAYLSPFAHITLSVNPSIEYTLSRLNVVLDVQPVNPDAEAIVARLDTGMVPLHSIDDILGQTCAILVELGYLPEGVETDIALSCDLQDAAGQRLIAQASAALARASSDRSIRIVDELATPTPAPMSTPAPAPTLLTTPTPSFMPTPSPTPTPAPTPASSPTPTPPPSPSLTPSPTPLPTSASSPTSMPAFTPDQANTPKPENSASQGNGGDNGNHYGQHKPKNTKKPKTNNGKNKK